MSRLLFRRPARRLLFALLVLAVIDPFIPGLLDRLERGRYESDQLFRFENSDLFSLGPLVQYLRAHPKGDRPRVVFFGNSLVWGYFLERKDSLPAQFQRLTPDARVFNMAINGFESGNAFLITKSIIDAVDSIYLFHIGSKAHPMLPQLVPVQPTDVKRFALSPPEQPEVLFASLLGFWHLYRDAYRLQAALFGTSTRQYVYSHKMAIPRMLWRAGHVGADERMSDSRPRDPAPGVEIEVGTASSPVTEARRGELAAAYPLLWDYAELVRSHAKHAVVVGIRGYSLDLPEVDRADLNRIFRPHVSFVRMSIPAALRFDGLHMNPEGTRAVARALRLHAPPMTAGK